MKKLRLAKRLLHEGEVDLRGKTSEKLTPGLLTYKPNHGEDGMCYNIADSYGLDYYGAKEGTVVSMWNIRGGQPHGHVYSLSNFNIFSNLSDFEKPYFELYGNKTYSDIMTPSYYNKVSISENGCINKEFNLTLDINNPENIIVWKLKNFSRAFVDEKLLPGRNTVALDGNYYELAGDQSIQEYGTYRNGLKNKTWIFKNNRAEGINNLMELVFESNGEVITSLFRGANLTNTSGSNKYFRTDNGQSYMTFRKKVVGKIHNGEIVY